MAQACSAPSKYILPPVYDVLLRLLARTENGKPYIDGNPLYFSLSHSGKHGVIAVCDKPVRGKIVAGADIFVHEAGYHGISRADRVYKLTARRTDVSACAFTKNLATREQIEYIESLML